MRQSWTDDRMDDLAAHVDAGFAQARVDLGSTREELRREIKELGRELRGELQALAAIVAAGQRTMLQICGGLCVALIAAVATLVSTVI